jgi:hypothetical protein
LAICGASPARADGRFGDSTWVAPTASFETESSSDWPRVALPDHERRWETVLRTPFRLVFLPLRLVAGGLEIGAGYFGPRYFEPKAMVPPKAGPTLAPNITLGGLDDIGVGPSITWAGFPAAGAKLHLSGSWSTIDRRRVHFSEAVGDLRPVGFRLGADYDYKPTRHYYGTGNNTLEADDSYYLLETTTAEAALRFGASPLRQVRIVGGYSGMSPRRGYGALPLLEDVFAPNSTPFERRATQEFVYGVTASLAALDDGRDPSRGVHGLLDLRHAMGLRASDPDYSQWRLEGRAYVPVFAKRRVIALRGVYSGIDPTGSTTTALPFYRLVQSDGATSFAGYASERFRDRQLLLVRAEYRWLVFYQMSALALYELGEVAPSASAFSVRDAHRSYGGGLRYAMSETGTMRLEVAKSTEGLHVVLEMGRDF